MTLDFLSNIQIVCLEWSLIISDFFSGHKYHVRRGISELFRQAVSKFTYGVLGDPAGVYVDGTHYLLD